MFRLHNFRVKRQLLINSILQGNRTIPAHVAVDDDGILIDHSWSSTVLHPFSTEQHDAGSALRNHIVESIKRQNILLQRSC